MARSQAADVFNDSELTSHPARSGGRIKELGQWEVDHTRSRWSPSLTDENRGTVGLFFL